MKKIDYSKFKLLELYSDYGDVTGIQTIKRFIDHCNKYFSEFNDGMQGFLALYEDMVETVGEFNAFIIAWDVMRNDNANFVLEVRTVLEAWIDDVRVQQWITDRLDYLVATAITGKLDETVFQQFSDDLTDTLSTMQQKTTKNETDATNNKDSILQIQQNINTINQKNQLQDDAINVIDERIKNRVLNVKDFGAKGDGVTDDSQAFKNAVTYAHDRILSIRTNHTTNGFTIYVPTGKYLILSEVLISDNGITVTGDGQSSILYTNGNNNILTFTNVSFALTNCEVSNLRFLSGEAQTSGVQLTFDAVMNSRIHNCNFFGGYAGLKLFGCAKTFVSQCVFDQQTRVSGMPSYAIELAGSGTRARVGDVHLTDIQIFKNYETQGNWSMRVSGLDGVYINQLHMHGGILCEPSLDGKENSMASFVFSNSYIDNANDVALMFTGKSTHYKDIRIDNSYFRGARVGVRINTTSTVEMMTITNSNFANNSYMGLDIDTVTVNGLIVQGNHFFYNGTGANVGAMNLRGNNVLVSGNVITHSDNATFGIKVNSNAGYGQIINNSFVSKSGIKIVNDATHFTVINNIGV